MYTYVSLCYVDQKAHVEKVCADLNGHSRIDIPRLYDTLIINITVIDFRTNASLCCVIPRCDDIPCDNSKYHYRIQM